MTPFKAMYGRGPPSLTRTPTSCTDVDEGAHQLVTTRDHILTQLQQNLHKAKKIMKSQADKKRRDVVLEVGDLALVKLQPYRQITLANRPNQKHNLKYFGPFALLARIGTVAYKLALPSTARIHPVFY
jgi:hypothetical protein